MSFTTSINIHPSPQHIPLHINSLALFLNAFGEKSIVYTHALATPSLQAIAMYAIRASIETIALAPSIKMFDAQASECVYNDIHRSTSTGRKNHGKRIRIHPPKPSGHPPLYTGGEAGKGAVRKERRVIRACLPVWLGSKQANPYCALGASNED